MREGVSYFDNRVASLATGGLGVLLLLGGAGCVGADADDDITLVTSKAVVATGPNGHTYTFYDNAVSWGAAKDTCTHATPAGQHLVSIRDATENAWLFQQQQHIGPGGPGGGNWWVGYTDGDTEGTWKWNDGMGQGYVNWLPGEPNNANNEDCVVQNLNGGGKWNDINCNNNYRFICETGGPETPVGAFWMNAINTNNDTQNYFQFAIDATVNHSLTVDTCSTAFTQDTYLRLMNPNGTELAANNNACGSTGIQSRIAVSVPTTGTYVIREGCAGSATCNGLVTITNN
jgi:hypothetical protein